MAGDRRQRTRSFRLASAVGVVVASCWIAACSTGVHHTVKRGENLYRIGKAYGIEYPELAAANGIGPPYTIRVGQRLYIPGADRTLPVRVITPVAVATRRPKPPPSTSKATAQPSARAKAKSSPSRSGSATRSKAKLPVSPSKFEWPVEGKMTSPFGPRSAGHHDGVDLAAKRGTVVKASRAGRVIFADRLSGYGNVVIVEHSGEFTTVYAHNHTNEVRAGDQVSVGQRIATVGDTGRAEIPHLHFEIRHRNVARDPMEYLRGGGR